MLSMPERPEFDRTGSILYFKVDDLEAARSTMIDRGVQFVDEPHLIARMPDHELWMSFFKDPSDNMLAPASGLMSEVRRGLTGIFCENATYGCCRSFVS